MSASVQPAGAYQGPTPAEPWVLLRGVPWSTYLVLRDTVEDGSTRLTYLEGLLEIMSPSRAHEMSKKRLARLLELFCLERDIPLFSYGSTTLRREEVGRGLEPDECYCRDQDKPMPELAIEVVVTQGAIDKLEVYRGLGIPEVWIYEGGELIAFVLESAGYARVDGSRLFPELGLERLAHYAALGDQHAALTGFRTELRAQVEPSD